MLILLLMVSSVSGLISSAIGWGSTINLNSYADSVCMINNVKQTLQNKCVVTCSTSSTILIKILSSEGNSTALYYCVTKPTLTSVDMPTLYSSTPYNLSLYGTNFFNSSAYCALNSTNFPAIFVSPSQMTCQFSTILPGNYTLKLFPNSFDSIGGISIKVLTSYRIGSIFLISPYVPTSLQVIGSRFDTNLYCNVSNSLIKVTLVNSSYATCALPSSLVGNINVLMQNSAGMVFSNVFSLKLFTKIYLMQVGILPWTGPILKIEYSGNIVENIYCNINGTNYQASFNTAMIQCNIENLNEGNYSVSICDSITQISTNSIYFVRKVELFNAEFFEIGNDLLVFINTSLPILQVYCKWGFNLPILMVSNGSEFWCRTSLIKDRGTWCIELSYDGINFTSSCLYLYSRQRSSNFVSIFPVNALLNGTNVTAFSNKLYSANYTCEVNGAVVEGLMQNSSILCEIPPVPSAGIYPLQIYQDNNFVTKFSINYVNYVEIFQTFPMYFTELTDNFTLIGQGFYENILCSYENYILNCSYINEKSLHCQIFNVSRDVNIYCLNIDNTPSENYTVTFRNLPVITQTLPQSFYQGVENIIFLQGENFYNDSKINLLCDQTFSYETQFYSPILISFSTYLENCNFFINSIASISVSANEVDYSLVYPLQIFSIPSISNLSFFGSPYLGGDVLTFEGNGFMGSGVYFCNFGSVSTPASITSWNMGTCTVPYHDIGTAEFFLSLSGLDYINNFIQYTFEDVLYFTIFPNIGNLNGGTVVEFFGNFSYLIGETFCLFGENQVPASVATTISCTTPSALSPGPVEVKIVSNGMKYYSNFNLVYFNYIILPTLTQLNIGTGPSVGNSTVIIKGSGFNELFKWYCIFGSVSVEAVYLDINTVLCYSPGQVPGQVNLCMTLNSQEFTNSLPFLYTADIEIYSFSPSIGPSTGSTLTALQGKNIANAIYCKIGNTITNLITNNNVPYCMTGYWWYGNTSIEVSTNGIDFTNSGIFFTFFNDFFIQTTFPRLVPNTGSFVVLSGINFPSNLRCKMVNFEVSAVYLTQNQIQCTVPPISASQVMQFTVNDQNYLNFVEITTLQPFTSPIFTSITQSFTNVGTYVKVFATGLSNNTYFAVNFNGPSYFRFITSTSFIIKISNMPSGNYNLKVSNNNQDFTYLTAVNVSDLMQVIKVTPVLASVKGGNLFSISVINAVNTTFLTCMFEMDYEVSMNLPNSYIVPATFYNSSFVTCVSPAIAYPGLSYIRISNDNSTFSLKNASITFTATCKDRVNCTGNLISACNAGYFCLGSFWYNPLPCPLGTYQNNTLQTSCMPCPIGQVCISPIIPSPCPPNFTCSYSGLIYPNALCPPGYYCYVNTSTAYAKCDSGNYCIGTNYPCLDGFICKNGSSTYYGESQCPEGHFCVGYHIYVCPSRNYCKGTGNTRPIPCPAGTYNPYVGQTQCITCPLGHVCPHILMLFPIPCPKGYICNEEGLTFPNTLCTPGYYCPEGVATAYLNPPCYGITYQNALQNGYCQYDTFVSVTDSNNYSGFIPEFNFTQQNLCCWNSSTTANFISQISSDLSFQTVSNSFLQHNLNGINLYTPLGVNRRLLLTISDYFSKASDQALFKFNLVQLLDLAKPKICPAGVFCLEGVDSFLVNTSSVRSPKICNPGTYCVAGSSTPAGQLCPSGYHCPVGSSAPVANSAGTFTSFVGNVLQSLCSPNYYSNQNASTFCYLCPDGYQCPNAATIWPGICKQGNYRNYMESSICSLCPLSSYDFDFGLISSYECMACGAGRICLLAGTFNISISTPCTQGDYCEEAADITKHGKCPPGFLCAAGTTPQTKFDIPCIEGFYCPLGTKYLNKYLYPCPDIYYCPPSTIDYSVFYTDPSTASPTSWETPPTICPQGTGKVSEGTRSNILMCEMYPIYNTSNPVVEINPIVVEISANFTTYVNGSSEDFIFHLESREVALVTIDLRHISSTMFNYGVDWAVSFTILPNITSAGNLDPVSMPQRFLKSDVTKTGGVLEFTILGWSAVDFKVSILIYNGLFHSYSNLFVNTTSVEIFTPNREIYGTRQTFLAMITNAIALPFNLPPSTVPNVNYLLTFSPSPNFANLVRIDKDPTTNWFQPNDKYWNAIGTTSLFLPYLPYFSNCEGYGQYIPIWAPFELDPSCKLIDPTATKPVIPFAFGSSAVADACTGISISCIYDELIGDVQATPRWFELPLLTILFFFTQTTVDEADFITQGVTAPTIPVTTVNAAGTLPAVVLLTILYQQFDQYTKLIILCTITFMNNTALTPDQQVGNTQTPYELKIVYRAMNQKELLVAFVFDYTFYLTFFVLVGVLTLMFGAVSYCYHKLTVADGIVAKFYFFDYFKLLLPPVLEGFIIGYIPIFTIFVLNSLMMVGYLFNYIYYVAGNEAYATNGIFDSLLSTFTQFEVVDPASAQRARLGISLVATGAYIMWVGTTILILDDPEEEKETPTGGIWSYVFWRRMNLIFVAMVGIGAFQGLVQLSYSLTFALNSYIFVGVLYIAAVLLEYYQSLMVNDDLLIEPFNQAGGMVTGVATFGASDFVVFLIGYFVGLANLIMIRLYLDHLKDWVFDSLDNIQEKLENLNKFLADKNTYLGIYQKFSSFNTVVPEDDEAEIEEKEDVRENPLEIEVNEFYDSDQEEVEEENSFYTFEDVLPSPVKPPEPPEELDEQEIEEMVGAYAGYSGDLMGYFFNQIFTIMCWNYYDYIPFFSAYGIAKPAVFFYVLFGSVIVPFQFLTDVFLHTINDLHNGWAVHDFLDFMRHKHANRKKRWIGSDPQNEAIIEEKGRLLYRLILSPHFYFVCTIFDSGFAFSAIGFVTILNNPGYNAFSDRATVPIILFSIGLCFVIHKFYYFLGNFLKIWEVKIEDQEGNDEDDEEEEINIQELYEEVYGDDDTEENIVPKFENWYKIEEVKAYDEVIQRELEIQEITSPEIREKFLEYNQEWLQENIRFLINDENAKEYKGIILTKLAKMYGFLNLSTKNREFPVYGEETLEKIQNPACVKLAKIWLKRARRNRMLFMQSSIVFSEKIKENCLYCGTIFTLQCELIENIEDLYVIFKTKYDSTHVGKMFIWNPFEWNEFLRENGHFRTICVECLHRFEEFNYFYAKNHPRTGQPPLPLHANQQLLNIYNSEQINVKLNNENRLQNFNITEKSRMILQKWLKLARTKIIQNI